MPSRTRERTWTHGQRDSTLRNHKLDERAKIEKRLSVKYYKTNNPPKDLLKDSIANGYCPWCDTDGWKILSLHTNWSHGITAAELRDMAGLYKYSPTCIPDISECRAKMPHSLINLKKAQIALKIKPRSKVIMSKAGIESARARLDKVRSPEQRRRATQASIKRCSKPHPCPVCGKMLPRANPITCSPECRKVIRQRTAKKWIEAGHSNEAREKMKNTLRNKVIAGDYIPPIPAKPHPCPVCGVIVPKASPIACSPACRRILLQRAQIKATLHRRMKGY